MSKVPVIPQLALLVLAAVLTSCTAEPATTRLTSADSGRTISLTVGDELIVTLEGNPSTGFDWQVVSAPEPVLQLLERTDTPQGTLVGAPATIAFRYKAAAQGQAKVTLNYWRSWESVPPQRTFEIVVDVRR